MTKQDPNRWLSGDSETDELLARVLASSAGDEPGAARVEALEQRVSLAAAAQPIAETALVSKLAAVVGTCAVIGAAIWLGYAKPGKVAPIDRATIAAPSAADVSVMPATEHASPEATPVLEAAPEVAPPARLRRARRAELGPPRREPADEVPQLERELRILAAMRGALNTDPCTTLRLGEQHRAEFAGPVLAPEREQLMEAARRAAADAGACAR